MNCLECGAINQLQGQRCTQCGTSLKASLASYYLDSAEKELNKGRYEQATICLTQADNVMFAISNKERENHLLTARAFWLQGSMYYSQSKMDRAKEELLNALGLLEAQIGKSALLAEVLNRLGSIYYFESDIAKALSYYQRSSEIASEMENYAIAAKATNNIGNIHVARGDIDLAAQCYSQGLAQAEKAGPVSLAQSYSVLTWLHSNYGPYSTALNYAEKAYALVGEIVNVDNRALIIMQIGAAYLKYGNMELAEKYLQEAYTLVKRTGNKLVEEQVLAELAELLRQKDDHEAWENYAIKAFRASVNSPYLRKESAVQLITYYIKQQDWARARRVLETMRANRQEGDIREDALISNAEALLAAALEQWKVAQERFEFAISSGTLTDYELALIWQDYAIMMLRRDKVQPDRASYVRAFEAAERASRMLQKLGLAHRFIVGQYLPAGSVELI